MKVLDKDKEFRKLMRRSGVELKVGEEWTGAAKENKVSTSYNTKKKRRKTKSGC